VRPIALGVTLWLIGSWLLLIGDFLSTGDPVARHVHINSLSHIFAIAFPPPTPAEQLVCSPWSPSRRLAQQSHYFMPRPPGFLLVEIDLTYYGLKVLSCRLVRELRRVPDHVSPKAKPSTPRPPS